MPDPARPAREPRVEVAGIEPAEPPVFTGLRRYSPAFSGHACPGGDTVDHWVPRICPRVPAASASGPDVVRGRRAAGVLLRVAVEALREDAEDAEDAGYVEFGEPVRRYVERINKLENF